MPVPATARMIQGMAFRGLDVHGELLTPTGAALLTALGTQRVGLPEGIIEGCGVGCGDRDVETHANVLRVFLLSDEGAAAGEERVCVLESDMDHIGGEIMAFAAEECLHSGALDVSWTPIVMKKGRPGCRLTVLCAPPERDALIALIVMHTRTLGVRWHEMRRSVAGREHGETPAAQGTVRNKQCRFGDYAFCKPEYEDMARIARDEHRSILDVYEQYTGGYASPRGD